MQNKGKAKVREVVQRLEEQHAVGAGEAVGQPNEHGANGALRARERPGIGCSWRYGERRDAREEELERLDEARPAQGARQAIT